MATTVDEVFTEMEERLRANPEKVKGMNATYQFDLTGEGGAERWVKLADGSGEMGSGQSDSPNITITMAASDFLDLVAGKLDGTMAFMSGKLKVKGDMGLAMKLQQIVR
ncbi:MAG: SCP2 sterol-binding domain-containing protein [Candidatus Dormibacteria bacterium]